MYFVINQYISHVCYRYKLKVRVMDETDSMTFVPFDKDAATLVKKSCSEILETQEKVMHIVFPNFIYLIFLYIYILSF